MSATMLSRAQCGPELLASIGSIAVESAYLERFIETMLYRLTKLTREMGYPIIEAGMIGTKIDLLKQVGKVKLSTRPQLRMRFVEIMSQIAQANSDRILAVHGVWQPDHSNFLKAYLDGLSRPPVTASKRNKDGTPDTKLEMQRAEKIAERISALHEEIHSFAEKSWPSLFPRLGTKAFQRLYGRKQPDSRTVAKRPSTPPVR